MRLSRVPYGHVCTSDTRLQFHGRHYYPARERWRFERQKWQARVLSSDGVYVRSSALFRTLADAVAWARWRWRPAFLGGVIDPLGAEGRSLWQHALVGDRLALAALLDMAEDDGDTKIIRSKVSRQDLAKVVGASREMVSRVMKDLEERGMVETQENGSVIIKERLA